MDRFKQYATDRLRENLLRNQAAIQQQFRSYTPPPAPTPIRQGAVALKQVASRPVAPRTSGAAILKAIAPPPPPSLNQRVAAGIRSVPKPPPRPNLAQAIARNEPQFRDRMTAPVAPVLPTFAVPTPQTLGFQPTTEEQTDESWTLWQSPEGTDVVMPSTYTPPEDWSQQAVLTEPDQIENARNSPISYENQPQEVQDLILTGDERPIYNDGQSPLWIGDDQTRMAEEARNEDAGNRAVTGQIKKLKLKESRTTPISIESDFARLAQEQASEGAGTPQGQRQLEELRRRMVPVSIASDQARLAQEEQSAKQASKVVADTVPFESGETPEGYIWIQREGADAPELFPDDEKIPVDAWQVDPEGEIGTGSLGSDLMDTIGDLWEQWEGVGTWAEEDVVPIWEKFQEDAKPIMDFLRMGPKTEDEARLQPEETLQGIMALAKASIALVDSVNIPDSVLNGAKSALQAGAELGQEVAETIPGWDGFLKIVQADIPGLDMSLADMLMTAISKPQEYTVEQMVEQWYQAQTGTDNTDGGASAPFGWILGRLGAVAVMATSFPDWVEENNDRAIAAYEGGFDSNGDGTPDVFGADAVLALYRSETGAFSGFMFDVATDPYNWMIFTGAISTGARNAGRGLRLTDSPGLRRAGTLLDRAGETGRIASRILEAGGTGGLELALDPTLRLLRKAPGVRQALASSPDQTIRDLEGGVEALRALDTSTRVDSVARGVGGNAKDVVVDGDAIVAIRNVDGSTRTLQPDHARELKRQLDTSTLDPSTPSDVPKIAALDNLAMSNVDATMIPPRFLQPIDEIVRANPGRADDIQQAIMGGAPAMRQHVLNMDSAYMSGRSYPDAAIDTSSWVAGTFRPLFEGMEMPAYVGSTPNQSATHVLAETVIQDGWESQANRNARAKLYTYAGANDSMRKTLPDNPTPVQVAQAERYANLVEEHARWNPDDLDSPVFQRAVKDAEAIRRKLAEAGVTPRRRYSLRIADKRNVQPATSPVTDTGSPAPQATDTTPAPVDTATGEILPAEDLNPGYREDALVNDVLTEPALPLFERFADRYHWTDADAGRVVDLLAEARKFGGKAITDADLNTPAGRGYMNDVQQVLDKEKGIANLESISSTSPSPKAKRLADTELGRLRAELTTLQRKLGLVDGGSGAKRIKAEGSVIPVEKSKAAKQYALDSAKLTGKEYANISAWRRLRQTQSGTVIDNGGLAYLTTPWGDVVLTPDQLAELTRHTFQNGDTSLDRWVKHINARVGNTKLTPEEIIEQARVATRNDLTAEWKELHPTKEPGILGRTWDKYTQYLRDSILGTWFSAMRYWFNTQFGNTTNLWIGGYGLDSPRMFNLAEMQRHIGDLRQTVDTTSGDILAVDPHATSFDRLADTFGFPRASEIRQQFRTDHKISGGTQFEQWADRHGLPRFAKRTVSATVTGDSAVLFRAQASDMMMRDIVGTTAANRELKVAIRDFRDAATDRLTLAGFSPDQITDTLKRFHDKHPTGFRDTDVQSFFTDAGLTPGVATRLARDWQSTMSTVQKKARQEITRVTFAGRETNLDVKARRVVMFSYFMSRQYNYLIRQALRHPGLINSYMAYQDAIDQYLEENPDMPGWLKGTLRITGMPGGTILHITPHALWEIGSLFQNGTDEFDDTFMEKWVLNNPYLMIHPGIVNALNIGGFLGDSRDVDFLNTHNLGRHLAFIENLLRGTGSVRDEDFNGWGKWIPDLSGGDTGLAGNPSDDLWNRARDAVSGVLDWIPGADEQRFIDSADQENAELRAIALDEAERLGMDPDDPGTQVWLDAQLADPNSDLYRRAYARYLLNEGTALLAKVFPLTAGLRPLTRIESASGEDLMNTLSDAMKNYVRTPDAQGRDLYRQMDDYFDLGDRRTQRANRDYNTIVYGTATMGVEIDGVFYSADEINAMSTDERKDLGIAFLVEVGMYEEWQTYRDDRDVFMADPDNAEYAQYNSWSTAVFQYPGGVDAYWEAVIEKNPNARRYFEGLDPNLTASEREDALTGTWAFFAVAGIQPNIYQPEPDDTNFWDPVNVANQAPQPQKYEPYVNEWEEDTRQQVTKWDQQWTQADPVVRQIMSDMGIDPNTNLNDVYYRTRYDIMDEYEARTGKKLPYEKSDSYYLANQFFVWVDQQPEGADTSLDAYFEQRDEAYTNEAPSRFNAEQEADDEVDPYVWYNNSRNKDPGYKWEDEGA